MIGGQNRHQEWTLRPRKVQVSRFRDWAEKNFQPGDAVVIETTGSVWDIYDIVAPPGQQNPGCPCPESAPDR